MNVRFARVGRFWLTLLCLLGGCASGAGEAEPAREARGIVYGLGMLPAGFDPHWNRAPVSGIPLRQIYDTLVYRDPRDGRIVPGLAREWTLSDDGLALTLRLRDDVRFHDGLPLNADAVAASLNRVLDPQNVAWRDDPLLRRLRGYEVLDTHVVRLVLSEPYSPLLDALSQVDLAIASPRALTAWSRNRYQYHQVGSGPFTFEEYVPGRRIVLRRNTDYAWGPAFHEPPNERSVERIEFRFYTDATARARDLASGEVQLLGGLVPEDFPALGETDGWRIVPVNAPGQPLQLIMNTQRFPTSLRALRQALIFGTDRGALVDVRWQQAPVAWGPLTSSTLYHFNGLQGLYAWEPARARELLAAAGYSDDDGDGVLEINGVPLQLDVLLRARDSLPQLVARLEEGWRELGIQLRMTVLPNARALENAARQGEHHLLAVRAAGSDPGFLFDWYHSVGARNWSGYADKELDDALEEGLRARDARIRRAHYVRAQQIIMEQALILPLREPLALNAVADGLEGLMWEYRGWQPLLANLEFTELLPASSEP